MFFIRKSWIKFVSFETISAKNRFYFHNKANPGIFKNKLKLQQTLKYQFSQTSNQINNLENIQHKDQKDIKKDEFTIINEQRDYEKELNYEYERENQQLQESLLLEKIQKCQQLMEILNLYQQEKSNFNLDEYIRCLKQFEGELRKNKNTFKNNDRYLLDDPRYKEIILHIFNNRMKLNEYCKFFNIFENFIKIQVMKYGLLKLNKILKRYSFWNFYEYSIDNRYIILSSNNLTKLFQYQIENIAFISWITKSQQYNTIRGLKDSDIKQFCIENEKQITKNFFNFYNLVYLLYNFELLSFNSTQCSERILKQVEENAYILTGTQIQLLLYTFSSKSLRYIPLSEKVNQYKQIKWRYQNIFQIKELQLAYKCSELANNNLSELSISNKAKMLYHLSTIQLSFNRPYFKTPVVIEKLLLDLEQNYLQLSEQEILHVSMSFLYLPNEINNVLLQKIKGIIINQSQAEMGKYLSFNTIVSFLTLISKMRRVYYTEEEYQKISISLVKILREHLQKGQYLNCEQLISLLVQTPALRSEDMKKILIESLQQNPKNYISVLEYFVLEKYDISSLVPVDILNEKFIQSDESRLYLVLKCSNHQNKSLIENTKKKVDEQYKTDIKTILHSFVQSHLKKTDEYIEMSRNLIQKMQNTPNLFDSSEKKEQFFSYMSKLINNPKERHSWIQWIDNNSSKLSETNTTIKLFQAFSKSESYNVNHLLIISHIASKPYVSLQSTLIFLKETPLILQGVHLYGNIIKRLLQVIQSKMTNNVSIRLDLVLSLYLIFKNNSFYISQLGILLKQAYLTKINESIIKENKDKGINQNIDAENTYLPKLFQESNYICQNFPIEMMKLDIYPENLLPSYYNLYFNELQDKQQKAFVLSQIIKYQITKKHKINLFEENMKQLIQQSQQTILSSSSQQDILDSISILFTFHYSVSSKYMDHPNEFIVKVQQIIEEQMNRISSINYMKIMNSIDIEEHIKYPQVYKPILNELVGQFGKNYLTLKNSAVISILRKFSNEKYINIDFINSVIKFSAAKFSKYTFEERVILISSFCNLKIVQDEFYDSNFQKIHQNPSQYRAYSQKITQSLFQIGYCSNQVAEALVAVAKSDQVNGIQDIREFYLYISVLLCNDNISIDHILTIYEIFSKSQKNAVIDKNIKPHLYNLMCDKILQQLIGDTYKNEIKNTLIKNKTSQLEQQISQTKKLRQSHQIISFVLTELNINHQVNYFFNKSKIYCDIYLPDKKIAINMYSNSMFGYDEITPSGKLKMARNYIKCKFQTTASFNSQTAIIKDRYYLNQVTKLINITKHQIIFNKNKAQTQITQDKYDTIFNQLIQKFKFEEEEQDNNTAKDQTQIQE